MREARFSWRPFPPIEEFCSCHYSTYDIKGKVTGGPALATGDLTTMNHVYDGVDGMKIEVPGLGYNVDGSLAESGVAPVGRFRLPFPTFPKVNYEVYFQEYLGGPASVQLFSPNPKGSWIRRC